MVFKKNSKFLVLYALALFILSAFYGLLIRWNFTFPIKSFSYANFLQGHSHVAFLGWGYIATIVAIIKYFVPVEKRKNKLYAVTIAIITTTITLMLISFITSGYKTFSIVLLSVFGIASYVLSFQLLKDISTNTTVKTDVKLIKYGIYYYLLSSLATWALAAIVITQGKTDLYYNTVYFYLHFLYNGYFVFVLFGIVFKIFAKKNSAISEKLQHNFFWYLNIACIPAYFLSVLWSNVSTIFYVVGFVASILQVISLLYLLKISKQLFKQTALDFMYKLLLQFAFIAYGLKIIIQVFSAFPYFVEKSLALKPYFIIGYLHLVTLAFISVLILFILRSLGKLILNNIASKTGVVLFLIGIFITELLLFLQGFLLLIRFKTITSYSLLVLIFSFFMLVGLLLIFGNQFFQKETLKK